MSVESSVVGHARVLTLQQASQSIPVPSSSLFDTLDLHQAGKHQRSTTLRENQRTHRDMPGYTAPGFVRALLGMQASNWTGRVSRFN